MSKKIRAQIVLDTETTGLEWKDGDRIIEIGCVRLDGRIRTENPEDRYHQLINPEREIPEDSIAVHHITNEMVADAPVFADIADDFLAFIADAELIIHNAKFDVGMINAELARIGRGRLEDYCAKVTDTLELARNHPSLSGRRASLDNLCFILGIVMQEFDERKEEGHGALIDAEVLAEVYLAMTRGQGAINLNAGMDNPNLWGRIPDPADLIVQKASEEELAEHEAMLDRVEKAAKATCAWRKVPEEENTENTETQSGNA